MTFTIAEVEASQTLIYSPADYLEHCQYQGEEPTNDGFLAYLEPEIHDDFGGYNGTLIIRYESDVHYD